jgi:glyoxylase-like metal-dependent hydrolase (beta-lactamase superfamily II)
VADSEAGEAIIIDAPKQVATEMTRFAEELKVHVREIICTHGHWDHTMGLSELIDATGATVACHSLDADMLLHPSFEPFSFSFALTPVTPDRLLGEDDVICVGSHRLLVMHTPGHTPGSICLYSSEDEALFSGDTLFAGTYGRVDFPGGDPALMQRSLRRLGELSANSQVYPGHGEETTIAQEQGWLRRVEEMLE